MVQCIMGPLSRDKFGRDWKGDGCRSRKVQKWVKIAEFRQFFAPRGRKQYAPVKIQIFRIRSKYSCEMHEMRNYAGVCAGRVWLIIYVLLTYNNEYVSITSYSMQSYSRQEVTLLEVLLSYAGSRNVRPSKSHRSRSTAVQLNAGAERPARTHACPTNAQRSPTLRTGTFSSSVKSDDLVIDRDMKRAAITVGSCDRDRGRLSAV